MYSVSLMTMGFYILCDPNPVAVCGKDFTVYFFQAVSSFSPV